jgi:hypothetical protein
MINQNLLLTGDDGYNLTNSLRFRSSVSAYLNRTPANAATSRRIMTYSVWAKIGTLGTQRLFYEGYTSVSDFEGLVFNTSNQLEWTAQVNGGTSYGVRTPAVFRDPSAWYHIVCAVDTTQATDTNRIKIYVNGVQQTGLTTFYSGFPAQNTDLEWNNQSSTQVIGWGGHFGYYDGYMTEINMIDGQALTPSSFGETSATTGVWIPKKYTGTYGTNGFYLPFTDNSALTTSSNVGLGKDFSGNSNYWTTNGISITSGSTYDSMTDVPTLTSSTAGNYAVLNPLKSNSSTSTYQNGNLQVTFPNAGAGGIATGTMAVSSGKWYWEVTVGGTDGSTQPKLGIISPTVQTETSSSIDVGDLGYAYVRNGNKSILGSVSSYGASFTTNDVIGFALDMDAGTLVCYKNNSSQGTLVSGLSGLFTVGLTAYNGYSETINFGQRPFAYTPPTGFVALNTFNLPTPTIGATASTQANKYMDATLYTGAGNTSTSITNAGGFQPDLVWTKARSIGYNHYLFDSVRGTGSTKSLYSDNDQSEGTYSSNGNISSFNSNGWTIGTTSGTNALNASGQTFVAWQWKANGSGSSNTAGSIISTVSANTTSGFSIVTYTGNGTGGATVGHGLGVVPEMIIVKNRSAAWGWFVYNKYLTNPNTGRVQLNLTNGEIAGGTPGPWNNTAPTSTVFSLGDNTFPEVNGSGNLIVAYCFAPVAGYSAFGSYTGNGSATGDGPFIYTGFRPRFVLWKNRTTGSQWILLDTARNLYNVSNAYLEPNTPDTENTSNTVCDILSNGFKIRNTTGTDYNASGEVYIYAAFAENPFKYANAR